MKHYRFGSANSKDIDVLFEYDNIPDDNNEAINICKALAAEYYNNCANVNLMTIKNGIVVNTITSKSTIDGLNNSLFTTYSNHTQSFPNPINRNVERNIVLNVYRCIRVILSFLSRTKYRTEIKSCLRGHYSFQSKLDILHSVDFTKLDGFNRKYTSDLDIWKTIPFYVGQSLSLLEGIEIYTKDDLVKYHPYFKRFIYREPIGILDKNVLNYRTKLLIDKIIDLNLQQTDDHQLFNDQFKIDMIKEK
jgi:hypothetical protein